ncbi:MAG: efflux RND transporter periplasmic adaptor subunit [Alphaproteobacteria bacterium]|nr:efflux RND transporter periplasmic adaptor subunit [Alphaproteobacteria bacterium]
MKAKTFTKFLVIIIAVAAIGGGYYYFQKKPADAKAAESGAPGGGQQQAMPVIYTQVDSKSVQIWNGYSARLEAVEYAEIRPQVSGTITEVKFEDGQQVEQGDVLFVIDTKPYQAAVNQAEAELKVSKNEFSLAQKEANRAEELIKTNAISKRIYDERKSTSNVAWARIKAAEARLERAQIDLDYANVKAPITGRVSRAEIKVGNLVEAGANAPLLTTIVSTAAVYADFEVDEQTYLTYIRTNAKDRASESKVPVKLILSGDSVVYDGFIDSFDNQIDASSGTIRARALFENKDGALLPGMFASVKMGLPEKQEKILLTERAIGTDQDRKYVYIVNDKNMVEYRQIRIGESMGGERVVTSGLEAGDKVITEGIIRLRPGMPVKPQTQAEADAAAAAQAAQSQAGDAEQGESSQAH